jgi:hypothetical protein
MRDEITLDELLDRPEADPKVLGAAKRLLEREGFVVADVREFRNERLDDAPFEFPNAPAGELPPVVLPWQRVVIPLVILTGVAVTIYLHAT